jgi:hypothetical protein
MMEQFTVRRVKVRWRKRGSQARSVSRNEEEEEEEEEGRESNDDEDEEDDDDGAEQVEAER